MAPDLTLPNPVIVCIATFTDINRTSSNCFELFLALFIRKLGGIMYKLSCSKTPLLPFPISFHFFLVVVQHDTDRLVLRVVVQSSLSQFATDS